LKGVSPKTLEWYKYAFKAFAPVLAVPHQSSTAFRGAVIRHIEALQTAVRGNKPVSINTYLRCLKTFLLWAHTEEIPKDAIKLSWLKEEQKILATLTQTQINTLLQWRPQGIRKTNLVRAHLGALTILDTGLNRLLQSNPSQVPNGGCRHCDAEP